MARNNHIGLIVGKRKTGKTTFCREKIMNVTKLPKTLVVDTLMHPAYNDLPVMPLDKIKSWKQGNYRLVCRKHEMDEALYLLNEYANNALIVFEDAAKYLNANLQDEVVSLLIDSKQKNVDIFIMFHEYTFVPPKLYRYTDSITIFKTKGSPARRKLEINMYDEVQAAWDIVKNHPSPYKYLTIETA